MKVSEEQSDTCLLAQLLEREDFPAAARVLAGAGCYRDLGEAEKIALTPPRISFEALHRLRQEFLRLPAETPPLITDPRVPGWVDQLRRDGVAGIGPLLKPEGLAQLQEEFTGIMDRLERNRSWWPFRNPHYDQKEYWRPKYRSYVANDPVAESPAALALAAHPSLAEAANAYLEKPAFLRRVTGMRYLPFPLTDASQFGWHHDMEERQFKVMILLTEVGPGDQHMSYVVGSHLGRYPYSMFLHNRLTFEDCGLKESGAKVFNAVGQPGDVFLFDSNGMHRGTRTEGRLRDALFIEFTCDKNPDQVWGTDLPPRLRAPYLEDGHPLERFMRAHALWRRKRPRRVLPAWAETLATPAAWV